MQLSIKATGENAQVVSHLLAKNPNNIYERNQKGHLVRMFYTKFSETEIEATIFVTPNTFEIIKTSSSKNQMTNYINNREFVVSSIFCTLVRPSLGTALNGQPHEDYLGWVNHKFQFEFSFGPVVSDMSEDKILELFEPLAFQTEIMRHETAMFINLKGETTLQIGLRQIFLLIPVLDNYKHYYIDKKEIEKVERYGEGWLDKHPLRDFILQRSLRFKEVFQNLELRSKKERRVSLEDFRHEKIVKLVSCIEPRKSIVDFGSKDGKLSLRLGFVQGIEEILAVDISQSLTLRAVKRFEKAAQKADFIAPTSTWGSLVYFNEKLANKDVMIINEVINNTEQRSAKVFETIFNKYKPKKLILTTNKINYDWCRDLGVNYGYSNSFDEYEGEMICIFSRNEESV
jgi:2-polyprenyl-3-methyl-5-hydroxy-6-metoxy-1,4-benzoquinol methylase